MVSLNGSNFQGVVRGQKRDTEEIIQWQKPVLSLMYYRTISALLIVFFRLLPFMRSVSYIHTNFHQTKLIFTLFSLYFIQFENYLTKRNGC